MRREFQMTKKQLSDLIRASQPRPVTYLKGGIPMFSEPRENAATAWEALSQQLGFDAQTVQPVDGKDETVFTAEEK